MDEGELLIECPTEGASIAYRFDDDKQWKLYTKPLRAGRHKELEVMACRIGWKPSEAVNRKL